MVDDPLVEQARRRAAVLDGKPYVAPDDGGVDGERVAAAEPEAAAHVERAARRRKRRLATGAAGAPPVGRVVVVEDDVRVVRLSELADVLNADGDPAGVGVSRAEADAALRRAGWRARWEPPVDIVDSVE